MSVIAIVGILEAVNKLALTVRNIKEQWKKDNPGQPIPEEFDDAHLITAFAAAIGGAMDTYDALIERLRARAEGEAPIA